jgi:hypothetical protein
MFDPIRICKSGFCHIPLVVWGLSGLEHLAEHCKKNCSDAGGADFAASGLF